MGIATEIKQKSSFVKRVLEDNKPYLPDVEFTEDGRLSFFRSKPPITNPTELQKYQQQTLERLNLVLCKIAQLEHVIGFLSEYRKTKKYQKLGITKAAYNAYHIENFYIRIIAIFDRALHLTNHVFSLGLPDNQVKYRLIIKMKQVKTSSVVKALKDIDSFLKKDKEIRNRLIHYEEYTDSKQSFIEGLEFFHIATGGKVVSPRMVNNMYKKYSQSKKGEFLVKLKKFQPLLSNFFESLLPVYTKHCEVLSK